MSDEKEQERWSRTIIMNNPIDWSQVRVTGYPLGIDTPIEPMDKDDFPWKYGEGELLRTLEQYLKSTYSEHYTKDDEEIQCFDAWMAMGDSWPTFRNTAVKYLWRYGKKDGYNEKDVLKAIHYVILMAHASKKEQANE